MYRLRVPRNKGMNQAKPAAHLHCAVFAGYAHCCTISRKLDSLRALHAEGRVAVLAEVSHQCAGVAPDDERIEPYWALAEELDLLVGIHIGTGRQE